MKIWCETIWGKVSIYMYSSETVHHQCYLQTGARKGETRALFILIFVLTYMYFLHQPIFWYPIVQLCCQCFL